MIPDGYNVPPDWQGLEQIAAKLGMAGGDKYYVDSVNGANGNDGLAWETAKASIAGTTGALAQCTADQNDIIMCAPGHVESVIAAAGLVLNKAGVTIIFLGNGSNRATIKFGTGVVTGADMNVTAANVVLISPRFEANIDGLTGPIHVTAAGFKIIDGEWWDGIDKQTTDAYVATADADYLEIDGWKYHEGSGGTQKQSNIQIAGATNPILKRIEIVGDFGTGNVENGTAWVDAVLEDVLIENKAAGPVVGILLQATSSGSMTNVRIRVASGVIYLTANNDMQFFRCLGASTDAAGADEIGTAPAASIEGKLDTIMAEMSGTAGITTWPAAAAPADTISMAEAIRYIVETLLGTLVNTGGTATLGGILGDVANISIATWLQKIGTLVNAGGTATLGGILGDVANTSIATRLTSILAAVGKSAAFAWGAADAGTNSATIVPVLGLAGYGDDFFNNRYYMQVLHNDNSAGNAPEPEVRLITDYVSATGTFTATAFSANVEASDIVLILHETAVLTGRDDNNNTAATTNVAANEDGSILERLEQLQEAVNIGTGSPLPANTSLPDFLGKGTGTVLPANTSLYDILAGANGLPAFPVAAVPANDISLAEVIRDIWAVLNGTAAGENGVQTFPASAVPANNVSLAEVLRDIWDAIRNGTGGAEPGTNRSIIDEIKGAALNYNGLNYLALSVDFTSATWNTVATHEVFIVTGLVRMRLLIECTEDMASAGAPTIQTGVEGATDAFIASSTLTEIDVGDIWCDATPTEQQGNFSSLVLDKIVNGLDVGYQIAVAAATDGTLVFHLWWEPLNATGAVVAGAGGVL